MKCPNCDATNPDDARWCSMCFASFEEAKADDPPTDPPAPAPVLPKDLPGIERTKDAGPSEGAPVAETAATWTCTVCEAPNPLTDDTCRVCGTSIFLAFGHTPTPQKKKVEEGKDASMAAMLSVVPGLGHLYLGLHGDGAGRLVLALWWTLSVGLLRGAPGTLVPIQVILIVGVVALAIASIVDSYRAVASPDETPIVGRKAILYASLGAVILLAIGAVLAFIPVSG